MSVEVAATTNPLKSKVDERRSIPYRLKTGIKGVKNGWML